MNPKTKACAAKCRNNSPTISRASFGAALLTGALSCAFFALFTFPVGELAAEQVAKSDDKTKASEKKSDDAAQSAEAKAAEKRKAALAGLEKQMRYASATERKRAIRRVTRLKPEEQEPFLKLLDEFAREDLDPSVREASLRTIGKAKYIAGTETVIAALADERREVRLAAISALDELESDQAKAPLVDVLKKADFTESDPTIGAAIRLLGRLKHTEIAPFLKEKAEADSTEASARLAIVLYFGRAGAVEMNGYLMSLVQDDDAEIITRAYAVNSVGKLKDKSRVPALREELDKIRSLANPRERARFSALKLQLLTALVRLGDDSVEKELLAAARDDDARVRVRAIGQIGEARLEKARPLLQYIIDHDVSKGARQAATKALKLLDGESEGEETSDADTEAAANARESNGQ